MTIPGREARFRGVLKRAFDLIVSSAALAVTSPLLLATAVAIKLDSKGPVFYRHLRVGKDGVPFRMLKFRSMVADADRLGGSLTVGGDPRITRVGRFIRKWKIDELPNFVNVLRGEMSVVGPRGEDPRYVALYTPEQRRVLSVKPGITDPALTGIYRNEQEILAGVDDPEAHYVNVILQDYLRMNLEYVERGPSLLRDLAIIARTAWAVLRAR